MAKYVYLFEQGNAKMRDLLGGKGANLCEMTKIGLPVPPGFILTTELCNYYSQHGKKYPTGLEAAMKTALATVERKTGKKFGDPQNPLLVSVRSGAKFSMPGMMDTVLNLGMNDAVADGLAKKVPNARFVYDSYRRFLQMFGDIVLGVAHSKFEHALSDAKRRKDVKLDTELNIEDLKELILAYKKIIREATGKDFPQDPWTQLLLARDAVFNSWNNKRAITYRKLNKIPDSLGTAVNIQSMVFGNRGETSGTGVAFTRNPSTGERTYYGEFLMNAQGEDVVAGIRTPQPLAALERELPKVYKQLTAVFDKLEKHYRDMQDIEFTIDEGRLYLLQTRSAKRTAAAAVRVAVEMVKEKMISKNEALLRVEPAQLDQLLHKQLDPKAHVTVVARGLPASPGAASGKVVFDADEAELQGKNGEKVILVRPETTPDDIHGMVAAQGILTSRGGMTSHAAVVARGMGKPCVAGCEELRIDSAAKTIHAKEYAIRESDFITIDGTTGNVILGKVPTVDPEFSSNFKTLLEWADQVRHLGVRTNADTPEDAQRAFEFGAEGVGLCRTEHMFFAPERLPVVQEMILAHDEAGRRAALAKLLPMQRKDFIGIFRAMHGHPVTIRLIDPPLHEFLPSREELMVDVAVGRAGHQDVSEKETLLKRVNQLHEFNPMLGLRGCRLGLVYPEIFEMQVRAIFEAAVEVRKTGEKVKPEIMIPLVGHVNEIMVTTEQVHKVAAEIMAEHKTKFDYAAGTMIELPRAAIVADQIAKYAEFFSFGTNDLTQTTFGFSRDDAEGKFLGEYVDKKILDVSPFIVLDREGVGELMKIAVSKGRKTRPKLKLGICGEHGGDPSSIAFCHQIGLNYVSCSPYRVPIARLAAAHAALKQTERDK